MDSEVWKNVYDSNFGDRQKADYGREDGITGYGWVARYTLHFLDAYLKHDVAALANLRKTPAENAAPRHFLSVTYRAASGVVPSFNAFRAEIGRQDSITPVIFLELCKKEDQTASCRKMLSIPGRKRCKMLTTRLRRSFS